MIATGIFFLTILAAVGLVALAVLLVAGRRKKD
jgi:hypothetical protein